MQVEILFKTHRYEKFDTSSQTCSEPYHGQGTAVLMDWNLYLGDLETQGVVLVQHWYDGKSDGRKVPIDGVRIPVAVRKTGCAMLLVDPGELGEIVWLKKDGEKILWREGDDLINGERFFAMEQLCYSDTVIKSINSRAVSVFEYLSKAHPDWSEEEVANSMGYTAKAIDYIRNEELAQIEFDDEDLGSSVEDLIGV